MRAAPPQRGRRIQGRTPQRPDVTMLWRSVKGIEDRAFLLAAGVYVFFGTLDCLTTVSALPRGGRERNPLASTLYSHFGAASLYAFKAAIVAVILLGLATLPRRIGVWVATVFTVGVGATVVANAHALTTLH